MEPLASLWASGLEDFQHGTTWIGVLIALLDYALVGFILYQLYRLTRGTSAIPVFLGLLAIYVFWQLISALGLHLLSDLLGQFIGVGVIAILIVFQQELRNFLLFIGDQEFLKQQPAWLRNILPRRADTGRTEVNEILDALYRIADRGEGALVVIGRKSPLQTHISSVTPIDARISAPLIESIFFKNSPLHDGALLIAYGRMTGVRAVLPVTQRPDLPAEWGMRHRAALGITEATDAVALVVSEEHRDVRVAIGSELRVAPSRSELLNLVHEALEVAAPNP
jgi:uncharacterized protein (TIGR00159 family)